MVRPTTQTENTEKQRIEMASKGALRRSGVFEAEELIRMALERHGEKLCVAWSGGRCSTVVLHMALRIKPDIKVIFCDTGVEYPETYKFVERIEREWNLNLIRTKPEVTFWQCVERYGFPQIRKSAVKGSPGTPRCCYWLKERPMLRAFREHGLEAELLGLRAAESRARMWGIHDHGQFYFSKKFRMWRYHPIAFWTRRDLEDYIERNDIPISELYSKTDRSGCWPCTGYLGWQKQLARTNFKLYKFLVERMGEQRLLEHYFDTQVRPCEGRG
jgi:phosphoadenosine phosphosulfate reductase